MRVVKPIPTNGARFTSSTIPEPDTASGEVEWTAGTYTLGQQRILTSTHLIYEVAVASTTDAPESGLLADPPSWFVVGYTNRWRMFDGVIGHKSSAEEAFTVEVTPASLYNGMGCFGLAGVDSALVTVTDPVAGEVYSNEIDLRDYSQITDWYNYFFSERIVKTEFALLDLPAYLNGVLSVTFDGPATVQVGELVIGRQLNLGVANYGTSLQLLDFSRKERDEFGNFIIVPRRTSKLVDFDYTVEKARIGYVFNQLDQLKTTPCIYVGTDETDDATLVYGYYRANTLNIEYPTINACTLQVEGLT